MSHSLVLVKHRLVALAVFALELCLSSIVEQELSLVQVFLLTSEYIQFAESHLGNLVSRHHTSLSAVRSHLTAHAVGISACNVEELP